MIGGKAGKILKLVQTGFLVETAQPMLVGKMIKETFELPVIKTTVTFTGVVVSTYDQASKKIAEVTFKEIDPKSKKNIIDFLTKIRQTS